MLKSSALVIITCLIVGVSFFSAIADDHGDVAPAMSAEVNENAADEPEIFVPSEGAEGEDVFFEDAVRSQPRRLSYQFLAHGTLYDYFEVEFSAEWKKANDVLKPLFGVHPVDLNGDGIKEYIVRLEDQYSTCNNIGCHHGVVSLSEAGEVKRLGYFEYSEIEVSNEEVGGVKNLLIYDTDLNDYTPKTFVWDTGKGEYTLLSK